MKEFMQEQSIAVNYKEREILRLNLKDSFQAGLQLLECQKAMNESKQDPFKESAGATDDDPFKQN